MDDAVDQDVADYLRELSGLEWVLRIVLTALLPVREERQAVLRAFLDRLPLSILVDEVGALLGPESDVLQALDPAAARIRGGKADPNDLAEATRHVAGAQRSLLLVADVLANGADPAELAEVRWSARSARLAGPQGAVPVSPALVALLARA